MNSNLIVDMEIERRMKIIKSDLYLTFQDEFGDSLFNVSQKRERQRIRLGASILFELGKADLSPDGKILVDRLGVFFAVHQNAFTKILVEGHTDKSPINTSKYSTNWDLSTARATTIVKRLAPKKRSINSDNILNPEKLEAIGKSYYDPITLNGYGLTIEELKLNRRIEFVLYYDSEEIKRIIERKSIGEMKY